MRNCPGYFGWLCMVALILAGCFGETHGPSPSGMKKAMENLAFTCTHEADHLPALAPQADELFRYARKLAEKAVTLPPDSKACCY